MLSSTLSESSRPESDGGPEFSETAFCKPANEGSGDAVAVAVESVDTDASEAETLGRGVSTASCAVFAAGRSGARHSPSGSGGTGGTGEVRSRSEPANARLCRLDATPLDDALRALNGLLAGTGGVEDSPPVMGTPDRRGGGTLTRRFDIGGGGGAIVRPGDLRLGDVAGDFGVLNNPIGCGKPDGGGPLERLRDDSVPKPCGPETLRGWGEDN